jgi:DNA modification methylase
MENDSRIRKFIIFCIEHYRQMTAMQSLLLFRQAGVFQYLAEGYRVLHTQSKDCIMADIDDFIDKHATVNPIEPAYS